MATLFTAVQLIDCPKNMHLKNYYLIPISYHPASEGNKMFTKK